jgi:hypothetical protein
MPTPRLPAIHQRIRDAANAFHEKKKSAAIAPAWKIAIKIMVFQLMLFFGSLISAVLSIETPTL